MTLHLQGRRSEGWRWVGGNQQGAQFGGQLVGPVRQCRAPVIIGGLGGRRGDGDGDTVAAVALLWQRCDRGEITTEKWRLDRTETAVSEEYALTVSRLALQAQSVSTLRPQPC